MTRKGGRRGRKCKQKEDLISWRRNYVITQTSKGRTQREIASLVHVGVGTINRDLDWFREKAKEENAHFIEKIQEEHEKSMIGLNTVLKEAWFIIENSSENKEKLGALSLVKDCYALREEMICNLPIIDEVLKLDSEESGGQEGKTRRQEKASGEQEQGHEQEQRQEQGKGVMGVEKGVGEEKMKMENGEDDDIQGSEEKTREDQKRATTNRTF